MSGAPELITLLAALGCGMTAGVWFAFSAFVMSALDRLPAAQGMAAMQSINVRALYLVGTIGVTMTANVPLNNRLASEDPQSTVGAERWSAYVGSWTAWNHVRCVTAVGAAALLLVALLAD
jgi:uncharacterized membrane protein